MEEIRPAGLEALLQNLAVVCMIRFLQDGEKGSGDYAKERHNWPGNPDLNEKANEIEKLRK